jgi:hypothetical protein
MTDEPTIDIDERVRSLERRLRRLEEERHAPKPPPNNRSLDTFLAWARTHGWTLLYAFIGVIELVAWVFLRDWWLLFGAFVGLACAWLSADTGYLA